MTFSPIAIVGRSCLLPGANSPRALWSLVSRARSAITAVDDDRWRCRPSEISSAASFNGSSRDDRCVSDRGGYVRGFDALWDPRGFAIPASELAGLDPLFHWVLYCAREALADAGDTRRGRVRRDRVAAIFGNLGFPTGEMCRYVEALRWAELGAQAEAPVDPRNRFMSGGALELLQRALGLDTGGFCLDAACASSLYAIESACDRLQERSVDRMLAGAVNRADDLFLHMGFSALQAMSPSGQSRPFHAEADGLVPAEGAGFLVLERLEDARRMGRHIYGVIRGIGLGNAGRGRGFLAPSGPAQVRVMQRALESAGLAPEQVSYLECHATGTRVGDDTELDSSARVYAGRDALVLGSLKANLGHTITVAGVAGVIKILEALGHGVLPTTPLEGRASDVMAASGFRLARAGEAWPKPDVGPRVAAISAFGFGGNDAHLLLSEECPSIEITATETKLVREALVLVGMGAMVGPALDLPSLATQLCSPGRGEFDRCRTQAFKLDGLCFPPVDLCHALPQQLMVLETAMAAMAQCTQLEGLRTSVLVGMEPDPAICKYGARWRIGEKLGLAREKLAEAREAMAPALVAAGVVGTMPNIVANRINAQLDWQGPSFSISAGEQSGLRALELAYRLLIRGEVEAVSTCAVDVGTQPDHRSALEAIRGRSTITGDAAVSLLWVRASTAETLGLSVIARLHVNSAPGGHGSGSSRAPGAELRELGDRRAEFGYCHAAGWLRDFTIAIVERRRAAIDSQSSKYLAFELAGQRAILHVPDLQAPLPARNSDNSGAGFYVDVHPKASDSRVGASSVPQRPEAARRRHLQAAELQRMSAPATMSAVSDTAQAGTTMGSRTQVHSESPTRVSEVVREQLRRLAELHLREITRQEALHDQFLAMQGHASILWAQSFLGSSGQVGEGTGNSAAGGQECFTNPRNIQSEREFSPGLTHGGYPEADCEIQSSPPPRACGPCFDRQQLEMHASGRISQVFGPDFADQDEFVRQVRMPTAPMLLADRVTGLDAEPHSLAQGTVWTETDLRADAWYLHAGHMPLGIMIEAGQADLFLVSYLGIDRINRGARSYRLLGCTLTFHGQLPCVGETLAFDIHIDGHASQGETRLMFFHYDCHIAGELRLSVRGGQAGFFSREQLAASEGCLWRAEDQEIVDSPRLDRPLLNCARSQFDADRVRAFAEGRTWLCFGPDGGRSNWDYTRCHTRTPAIAAGRMQLIERVDRIEFAAVGGGPWGRGYMQASAAVVPDSWYFEGHFLNDPCMPGTLMFEAGLQAMAFYMAAHGYTVHRDGWRFEAVPDHAVHLQCRGQVTPSSRQLVYELFVEEIFEGDRPTLYADLLVSVDGLAAFHARKVGLRLVPGWPCTPGDTGREPDVDAQAGFGPVDAKTGFVFDEASLRACALGRPTRAFGPSYLRFDGPDAVARLPGPPYGFVSRIVAIHGPDAEQPIALGSMRIGTSVDCEYDIPPDAWYFAHNGNRSMPFAVLLEAALQPCGWLASYMGCALSAAEPLKFRNLDGTGTLHREVFDEGKVLRTRVRNTSLSSTKSMIIVGFELRCWIDDELVYEHQTVFGFFPTTAFVDQDGLPADERHRSIFRARPQNEVDLRLKSQQRNRGVQPRLAASMLRMIDRVSYFSATGGSAGLGVARGEKLVNPGEWFFKAHFFQDPVQPGSLGIEAMLQLLQWTMRALNMHVGMAEPRFEALALKCPLTWKYRGQVLPTQTTVTTTLELVETRIEQSGAVAVGDASLWVDGKRIYEVRGLAMRIVDEARPQGQIVTLDPDVDSWLRDHCPTYTQPALPMSFMLEILAAGARPDECIVGLRDLRLEGWVVMDRRRSFRVLREGDDVWVEAVGDAQTDADGQLLARARLLFGRYPQRPELRPELEAPVADCPYASGRLFHGPSLQLMANLRRSRAGACWEIGLDHGLAPGRLQPAALDAATHGLPHDELDSWDFPVAMDGALVAYPAFIPELDFYGPTPHTGRLRCEARPAGVFANDAGFPVFDIELSHEGELWCRLQLVEACYPKGRIGRADPRERRAYLRDRVALPELCLSDSVAGTTQLDAAALQEIDWFPGTVAGVYGTRDPKAIARAEHIARAHGLHPHSVEARLPCSRFEISVAEHPGVIRVSGSGRGLLDLSAIRGFWQRQLDSSAGIVEDLYYATVQRFVDRVVLSEADDAKALSGRPCVFLANHQVGVESLCASVLLSGLVHMPVLVLAKIEHQHSWLGTLIRLSAEHPQAAVPRLIRFFDRADPSAMPTVIADLARWLSGGGSILLHVEGTRSLMANDPVEKMSGAFLDLALRLELPVVPLRFVGGLPLRALDQRIEFPVGFARQSIFMGTPISPVVLAQKPYDQRKRRVIAAINDLGPRLGREQPALGDPEFAERVGRRQRSSGGLPETHAALIEALVDYEPKHADSRAVLAWSEQGERSAANGEFGRWLSQLARWLLEADYGD